MAPPIHAPAAAPHNDFFNYVSNNQGKILVLSSCIAYSAFCYYNFLTSAANYISYPSLGNISILGGPTPVNITLLTLSYGVYKCTQFLLHDLLYEATEPLRALKCKIELSFQENQAETLNPVDVSPYIRTMVQTALKKSLEDSTYDETRIKNMLAEEQDLDFSYLNRIVINSKKDYFFTIYDKLKDFGYKESEAAFLKNLVDAEEKRIAQIDSEIDFVFLYKPHKASPSFLNVGKDPIFNQLKESGWPANEIRYRLLMQRAEAAEKETERKKNLTKRYGPFSDLCTVSLYSTIGGLLLYHHPLVWNSGKLLWNSGFFKLVAIGRAVEITLPIALAPLKNRVHEISLNAYKAMDSKVQSLQKASINWAKTTLCKVRSRLYKAAQTAFSRNQNLTNG